MKIQFAWPLLIFLSAIAACLAVLAPFILPLRVALTFWFMLVCPGMAFVPLLKISDRATQFSLGVALSLVMDGLVAESMVLVQKWSPQGGLFILVALSLVGALLQVRNELHDIIRSRNHLSDRLQAIGQIFFALDRKHP